MTHKEKLQLHKSAIESLNKIEAIWDDIQSERDLAVIAEKSYMPILMKLAYRELHDKELASLNESLLMAKIEYANIL